MKRLCQRKLEVSKTNYFTLVVSPIGYGKTTNVREFVDSCELRSIWIEASASNDMILLWREIIKQISVVDSKVSKMNISSLKVKNWLRIIIDINNLIEEEIYIIIDDLSDNVLNDLLRALIETSDKELRKIHFIIISEKLSNASSPYAVTFDTKSILTDRDFWLDIQDIGYLFRREKIHESYKVSKTIYELSQGWPPAVYSMFYSYKRTEHIYDLTYINEYLFNNILKNKSHELIVELANLSLFDTFTMDFVKQICKYKGIVKEIMELQEKGILVRDSNFKDYKYQKIIKEAFRNYIDSDELYTADIYKQAGEWYLGNKEPLIAIEYFYRGKYFDEIVHLLEECAMSYMDIDPILMQKIFECLPSSIRYQHPYIYLSYICGCMTNVDIYTGLKLLNEFKNDLDENRFKGDKNKLMGEYYFVKALSGYNDIFKMLEDFKISLYYLDGQKSKIAYPKMVATFGSCSLLYLYHYESGKLKDLVETFENESKQFTRIAYGVNAGGELLIRAERNYEIGDFSNVISLAKTAYQEAKQFQQISICVSSLFIQGRWALINHNKNLFLEIMNELMNMYSSVENPILVSEIDCAISWLNILDNRLDHVSDWIKKDNISKNHLLHEAWTMGYVVIIMYSIKLKEYKKLLNYCNILDNYFKEQMHVMGLIYVRLGEAIAYSKLNEKIISKENLIMLFEIAEKDGLLSIFYEFKEEVLELLNEMDLQDDYSRNVKKMLTKPNLEDNTKGLNSLTKKEYEVVSALIEYGSYSDVSDKLYISINTVKSHMKKVYLKLQINSRMQLSNALKVNDLSDIKNNIM